MDLRVIQLVAALGLVVALVELASGIRLAAGFAPTREFAEVAREPEVFVVPEALRGQPGMERFERCINTVRQMSAQSFGVFNDRIAELRGIAVRRAQHAGGFAFAFATILVASVRMKSAAQRAT
jgi:hypothetical protein